MIKKIICFVLIILILTLTPLTSFITVQEAYASTSTLDSELLKQTLIPLLISAGLVFNTTQSAEDVYQKLNDYFVANDMYMKYWQHGPEDPKPDLKTVLFSVIGTSIAWDYLKSNWKWVADIPKQLWEDIKSFVDDNYDEGDNLINKEGWNVSDGNYITINNIEIGDTVKAFLVNRGYVILKRTGERGADIYLRSGGNVWELNPTAISNVYTSGFTLISENNLLRLKFGETYFGQVEIDNYIDNDEFTNGKIVGTPDIVDNPNYDWNNNKTGTKTIPIPIQTDINGNPKVDENGFYLPSIDTEEWIGVTPDEIPNLNPSGIPNPDIPDMPVIEDPDDQTGVIIWIGNVMQIIVGQLSKIVEGVATIVANTNQMIFGTPTPTFDPITGVQIDPETGEPVQPEPEPSVSDGIIGDGIDTNISTDFEWGDFRHFLDIFFIFIYFIIILILILLKFLQIVFTGLPGIAPNTELFEQYPTILEGVNFIKNLQVGGLTITVQQSFEFVFMIFFYIFVIKQIRKLYNAAVNEDYRDFKENSRDMRLDYYEKNKNSGLNTYKSNNVFSDLHKNSSNYENIKFTDYTE